MIRNLVQTTVREDTLIAYDDEHLIYPIATLEGIIGLSDVQLHTNSSESPLSLYMADCGLLHISFSEVMSDGGELTVYDILGHEMIAEHVWSTSAIMNTSALAPGTYVVHISSEKSSRTAIFSR